MSASRTAAARAKRRPPRTLRLSPAGVRFIAAWEGFVGHAYNDAAGHATIGYGHLLHHGSVRGAERGRTITKAQALLLLENDARGAADAVRRYVRKPLSQHEFDALVSFTFNCGAGALASSSLLRDLNRGRRARVPADLKMWSRAGGRVLAGLLRRRNAEGRLFRTGSYSTR